jgi:pyrroloquinoline quinone biosynthesis protein A
MQPDIHENHEAVFMNAGSVFAKRCAQNAVIAIRHHFNRRTLRRYIMWTKPAATEMRFGFEVTMYVCNR